MPLKKTDSDIAGFSSVRRQSYPSLHDNINARLPASDLIASASVLDTAFFPADLLDMALFGENDAAKLCSILHLDRYVFLMLVWSTHLLLRKLRG